MISLFCAHLLYFARLRDYDALAETLSGPRPHKPISEPSATSEWREAGAPDLPGHIGASLKTKGHWLDQTTSSYYGGLMNIDLPPLQHRMIRSGDLKLSALPTLYNLADDLDELTDLANCPAYTQHVTQLSARLFDGWDATAIGQQQSLTQECTAIIRDLIKTTNPPEPSRWFDPNKDRNRYE